MRSSTPVNSTSTSFNEYITPGQRQRISLSTSLNEYITPGQKEKFSTQLTSLTMSPSQSLYENNFPLMLAKSKELSNISEKRNNKAPSCNKSKDILEPGPKRANGESTLDELCLNQ